MLAEPTSLPPLTFEYTQSQSTSSKHLPAPHHDSLHQGSVAPQNHLRTHLESRKSQVSHSQRIIVVPSHLPYHEHSLLNLDIQAPCWYNIWYDFYFFHLLLAMRRFYLGPQFGISTEDISYTQVRLHPEESASPSITSLFSIDAQICCEPPAVVLRIQEMMFVPRHK